MGKRLYVGNLSWNTTQDTLKATFGANGRTVSLRSPPGNRLEALRGDLRGFHSIRINQQWRIVFRWTSAGPEEVGILDYH